MSPQAQTAARPQPVGRLSGRTALITGGAGGAGRASSVLFADEGARVVVVDMQAAAGAAVIEEIRRRGGEAMFVEADVSDEADVRRAFAECDRTFGPPNVLFNHAGTVIVKRLVDMTVAEWDRLMSINVRSMFLTAREALRRMVDGDGGVVLNTSSISGVTASPLESAYCTTKGAVLQLTRAIAVEYRGANIRCNAICPGFTRTAHGVKELAELRRGGVDVSESVISEFQGRLCEPEEIAATALTLVSDDTRFVNGAALYVDNGWMALT